MILGESGIILRAIELEDASFLKSMINDPDIERMVLGWSFPVSTIRQIEWIQNLPIENMKYIIDFENQAVGLASISSLDYKNSVANLNIKIMGENRGEGIGTKVIKLLVEFAFNELNLNCLTANILEYNNSSIRLFERCGFKQDGILRSRIYKGGVYHNILVYSVLRDEFRK